MKISKEFIVKRLLPIIIGMIGGYAYYYFIGCNSGNCAIQSNPLYSTLYGGLIGLIIAIPTKKKEKIKSENNEGN